MKRYKPKEIVGEVDGLEVLKDPESQNFAPNYVRGETDIREVSKSNLSEDIRHHATSNDFDLILYDKINGNIIFDEANNNVADFYRAVAFGQDYTLIQSISDDTVGPTKVDSNFENSKNTSVLHYLTKDTQNFRYEGGEYMPLPNNSASRVHRKSREILEERPFDGRLLEPADDRNTT